MVRARAKERRAERARIRNHRSRLSSSKDTADTARNGRHKRADCRKRIADGKSKGGAAASADNDGDVAAVMDIDDFVLDAERDDASTGFCLGVSSMCAVLGSTGSLLLDSGSDEHLCSPKFADLIPTGPDRSLLKLKDVQQNDLTISGQKIVSCWWDHQVANRRWKLQPHSVLVRCVTISCRW